MKKYINILLVFIVSAIELAAQPSATYYDSAVGKTGAALKTALYNIITNHTVRTYSNLWTDFQTTDCRADGKVWDMYSNCTFTFVSNQCGNYSSVCDCYNREHSFPKSWFGGEVSPMYTDLFHLYPTDGQVNGQRSNYPYGETNNGTTLSGGKGKLGTARSGLGYSGTVFEPDDEYKGDFARTYFYMVTCYENQVASWYSNTEARPTLNGTAYPAFQPWAQTMFLAWNAADPVSAKEIARNNAVESIQNNRNPFIDHPELAEYIWGNMTGTAWQNPVSLDIPAMEWSFSPNPAQNEINITSTDNFEKYTIFDVSGRQILTDAFHEYKKIDVSELKNGIYFISLTSENQLITTKKMAIVK